MPRYNPAEIEPKWQAYWETQRTFRTPATPPAKNTVKRYVLDMFPYPSGDGLHVGHPEGYTATDIVCRFARMKGESVLHPMGFDSFGLPAEEHAIKTNTPPRIQTEKNIATFRRQLKMLGFSYDWDRELATTDVPYFRWTQWIFLVLFDSWFDPATQKARPISELPIPDQTNRQGADAVREFQDAHRLAFQSDALVNWCPALGTVLSNEEVIDGRSERGNHPVQRIPLRQWMLRITAYADRLEQGLENLDWPTGIKKRQCDWIGRSTGAEVDFYLGPQPKYETWRNERKSSGFPAKPDDRSLRVFTTRPDTLFGATYMVIAPEHPFAQRLTTPAQEKSVRNYIEAAARKSDLERTELSKVKSGVFTGSHAINPVNGSIVPIWIADYVLISYGTGAIMAVPAHDARDFEFAQQFSIPITAVVDPGATVPAEERDEVLAGKRVFPGDGTAVQSDAYSGLPTDTCKVRITEDLQTLGLGQSSVNYKLRDWLFSRQRFWGEPIPVLHELDEHGNATGRIEPVGMGELPVNLPHLDDFKPHGRPEPPLAKAPDDWLYVTRGDRRFRRETNTMPQWAGSCWYYLRFIDPRNDQQFISPELEAAWMPVDLYVGGAEHAVLHLLYARFWHMVLYDRGFLSTPEPFRRLINQGMILGETEYTAFRRADGSWVSSQQAEKSIDGWSDGQSNPIEPTSVPADQVKKLGDSFVLIESEGIRVDSRAHKMSKSRGNVINPDDVVQEYGADTLRLYEMYMGPLEATKPWNTHGVSGIRKFLDRVWRLIVDDHAEDLQLVPEVRDVEPDRECARQLHKTIAAVSEDLSGLAFNTAIARMIEFVNYATKQSCRPRSAMETLVLLLSPFAPHLCEELWQVLGHSTTIAFEPWPKHDPALAADDTLEIPVQINGKVRSILNVPADCKDELIRQYALADVRIVELLQGRDIAKVVVVPRRLVNIVLK
ncbi:MAG: leucine--tRNA ligase [Planctomycetota bacterium]|nr:leucine--tRNA ligase [Planctomycetota bacterium]MDA1179043.1 leucine--tRNA ligase [Planctomycetota bacterium]